MMKELKSVTAEVLTSCQRRHLLSTRPPSMPRRTLSDVAAFETPCSTRAAYSMVWKNRGVVLLLSLTLLPFEY